VEQPERKEALDLLSVELKHHGIAEENVVTIQLLHPVGRQIYTNRVWGMNVIYRV
jgi:hypothetical protein